MTTLLRGDNVPYKVSPVDGYGAVAEAAASAAADVRSVVLLNCGAAVDVEAQFAESSATIFVLDHHRPLHLRKAHRPTTRYRFGIVPDLNFERVCRRRVSRRVTIESSKAARRGP